jgi:nitroreductase
MTTIDPVTGFDTEMTDRLLSTTRSVRKRLDFAKPVDRDVVLDCLRIALQSPTGGNSQRWRFLVVDEPNLRSELAGLYRKSHDPYMAANVAALGEAAAPGTQMGKVTDSSSYLSEHMHEVPVHVIPCWLDRLPEGASNLEMAGVYGSILPAVWSFMLALRSRGLGAAWTTLHLAYEAEAAELLGIPPTVTQCALIPVAHYTGEDFKPANRKPVEAVTYLNTWGNKPQ